MASRPSEKWKDRFPKWKDRARVNHAIEPKILVSEAKRSEVSVLCGEGNHCDWLGSVHVP